MTTTTPSGLQAGLLLVVGLLFPASQAVATPGQTEAPATAEEWRHLEMQDIEVDWARFRPLRARYLQIQYDLEGGEEPQSSSLVHIDLDLAVDSGPWDGITPAVLEPLREPGLLIVWQVQNALYNAFDRVLTDRHVSLKGRVMPGGTGMALIVGSMEGDLHTRIVAAPPAAGETVRVDRRTLPEGSVNVLSAPYALAALELRPGDRFTLPGYALIGGTEGAGIAWRGAYEVRSVDEREVQGQRIPVAEVMFQRLDERNGRTLDDVDFEVTGVRMTRLLISPEPPYLLGRADMMRADSGEYRFVREFLGLLEWAEQPLPLYDAADESLWSLDLEAGTIFLRDADPSKVQLSLRRR